MFVVALAFLASASAYLSAKGVPTQGGVTKCQKRKTKWHEI